MSDFLISRMREHAPVKNVAEFFMERQEIDSIMCHGDTRERQSYGSWRDKRETVICVMERQERNIHVWHGMKREVVRCVIEGQETHRHMCHREKKYSQTFVL